MSSRLTKPDQQQIDQMNAEQLPLDIISVDSAKAKAAMDAIYSKTTLSMPVSRARIWGAQGDQGMSEQPSLERVFTCIGSLQSELDDLSAKDWGAFNPKRTVVWWKRMPFKRKMDWFLAVPGILFALLIIGSLLYALYQAHWLAGTVVSYALVMGIYVTWRNL